MKKVERKPRKNCILCEKEINRHSNTKGFKLRRGNKTITCSKRCSRIYIRVSLYIGEPYRARIKKLEKKK